MKFVKILLLVILTGFVATELYWMVKYKGNLIIYVQNQTFSPYSKTTEFVSAEVLLDNEQIFLSNNLEYDLLPANMTLMKNIGNSNITVKRIDNNTIKSKKVFHFLVTWVIIDIYSDKLVINEQFTPPLFQ